MSGALAIILVVLASVAFAGGAIAQHRAIRLDQRSQPRNALSWHQLTGLLSNPRWLMGVLLMAAAAALHITALSMAPVSLIQPIGVLAVPWSVLLAIRLYGHRTSAQLWMAVAVTLAGLAGFTILASTFTTSTHTAPDLSLLAWSVVLCGGTATALVALSRSAPSLLRSFAWAAGAAVLFGLVSALLKSVLVMYHAGASLLSPAVLLTGLAIAGAAAAGAWLTQQAYALGHPEVVVAALTTIDPVVAVVYGLVVLHEGANVGVLVIVALAVFGAVAIAGVAGLSRHHPEAVKHRSLPLLPSGLTEKQG
ncbi:DMT family transporter [Bogoriella caseilytica]|uniref:Magnesium transporter NIPA n=1 Tax=Bogoriella caseilytica TaxID=56055 RepID=A0A3N2BGS0_9MICO|nr:DMT family transporter [Bogoriella caseilytica]ROR74437.1 magnesium transporter NIPA [Bogoriella caseilytica]